MQPDAKAEEAKRRAMEAAHQLYFVPSYQGHWIGAVLLSATMAGAAMLYSFLPTALAVVGGAGAGRPVAVFLVLYAAMAVCPIGGWILWAYQRRWAALAVTGLFAVCAVWLASAAGR